MRKKTYTKNVGVLLSDEQYKKLIQITDEIEMTLSEYIRTIVVERLGQIENDPIYEHMEASE
jgi:hypothetical protein